MFSKKSNTNNISSMSTDRTHSVLSQSVKIAGEINSKDDLRIDGIVEGNINCEGKVIVGAEGSIIGNVKSKSIELMGRIVGDALVSEIIRLKSTSYFKGEITATNIEIEAGANFFGNCKMTDKDNKGNKAVIKETPVAEVKK